MPTTSLPALLLLSRHLRLLQALALFARFKGESYGPTLFWIGREILVTCDPSLPSKEGVQIYSSMVLFPIVNSPYAYCLEVVSVNACWKSLPNLVQSHSLLIWWVEIIPLTASLLHFKYRLSVCYITQSLMDGPYINESARGVWV